MTLESLRAWYAPRHRVSMWIFSGWTSFFVVLAVGWQLWPRAAPIAAPVDRALLALQLAAGPAFVVLAVLQSLWRVLDTVEAEDPLRNAESAAFKINQRVMSNTIEQAAIFVPMMVALAIRMRPDEAWALPMLTTIWCTGRLLFWAGYRRDPAWRAIGMDWTSGVATTTACWLAWTVAR